jgi:hypothetical protein
VKLHKPTKTTAARRYPRNKGALKMECKSLNHVYSIGEQVFDLMTQQMSTITKIKFVIDDGDVYSEEERQSLNPNDKLGDDEFFVITLDVANDEHHGRTPIEFCLPEEAERYRGFPHLVTEEFEAQVRAHGWPDGTPLR